MCRQAKLNSVHTKQPRVKKKENEKEENLILEMKAKTYSVYKV
jgi:hypothetical protein